MSTRGEQSAFDSALEGYKSRLQSIKASEAVDIARRIAESDNPVEEARQAVEQIVTPIGIDIVKDAIMHKLGMKGNLKKALKNSINKVIEARKQQVEQLKQQLSDAKDKADKLTRQGQNSNRGAQDPESSNGDAPGSGTGDDAGDANPNPQPEDPASGDVGGSGAADDALGDDAPAPTSDNTLQAFKDHIDDRLDELRGRLNDDPNLQVKVAGQDGETNIGSGFARQQHSDFAEANDLDRDVGPEVEDYIKNGFQQLKSDFPDRVSFGQVGGDIPENELHVWGANKANVDLPDGTPLGGGGQAADIGTASPNEFGIISTPKDGVPGVRAQPPAGAESDLPESIDVDGLQNGQDVRNASSALKQRFNNLTPEAQQRVTQNYADDDGVVRSGEGEGPEGRLNLDDYKINLGTMQENIENEEKAGNIKPQTDSAAQGNAGDVDANAGVNTEVNTGLNRAASTRVPVQARPNAAQDQLADADPEAEGVLGQGGNGLEDNSRGIGGIVRNLASRLQARLTQANVPNQASDGQVPGLRAQATSQGAPNPAGDSTPPASGDTPTPPKPPTAPDEEIGGAGGEEGAGGAAGGAESGVITGAESGAAGAESAATGAITGATSGLEATEAGLLASAPETGGLGAAIAGIVGIGAALASIFAPHHHKEAPPPPTPNLSTPVLQLGI